MTFAFAVKIELNGVHGSDAFIKRFSYQNKKTSSKIVTSQNRELISYFYVSSILEMRVRKNNGCFSKAHESFRNFKISKDFQTKTFIDIEMEQN